MPGMLDQYGWLGGEERPRLERMIDRLTETMVTLENADKNWDTITVVQQLAAQRLAVRNVARLTRIVLAQFEAE